MNKVKKFVMGLTVGVMAFSVIFGAQNAFAVTCPSGTSRGGQDVSSLAECSIEESDDTLMSTIATIINVALGVLGIVAVIVIIYGGFTYVTSSGDAAKLTKARNTIIYSVIGLIVSLLAFAIVNFVLKNVFNPRADTGEDSSLSNPEKTKSGTK